MCMIELEPCDVWSETKRKARKEHRCFTCLRVVRVGEHYYANFSKYEGDISFEKICDDCHTLRGEFAHAHKSMIPQPSFFVTMLEECIADEPESERLWKPMLAAIKRRHTPTANLDLTP